MHRIGFMNSNFLCDNMASIIEKQKRKKQTNERRAPPQRIICPYYKTENSGGRNVNTCIHERKSRAEQQQQLQQL